MTEIVIPTPNSRGYNRLIDALNRLPRPLMTMGTVLVFAYAMADPAGFTNRMQGLDQMPEAMWWLLGGVISFYFGAREAHYYRKSQQAKAEEGTAAAGADAAPAPIPAAEAAPDLAAMVAPNPALAEWLARLH